MEKRAFEIIKTGVCAYFLILFSCLKIFEKLWFSSAQDSMAGYLLLFIVYIVMLPAGFFLFHKYREALAAHPEEKLSASTAAKFIGGCVILADCLKTLIPSYIFSFFEMRPGQGSFLLLLMPAALYLPALIAAVAMIRSGSLKKAGLEAPERIAFLSFRTVLIYFFISCLHQMFVWLESSFWMHSFSHIETSWILVELALTAASLVLFFAPLRMKAAIKDSGNAGFSDLSRRSFELGGWLIVINGSSYILNYLTRSMGYFVTAYGEFGYWEHLRGFAPGAFLIAAGLLCICYGRKHKSLKNILLLFLLLTAAFLPGCGGKDAAPVADADGTLTYSDAEIKEMFLTLQDELLAKLGDGYELVPSGSEGAYEGYYYKDLGLTFIFNHKLLWIDCDNNVAIHGARPGMTFAEIMKVLGDTEIQDTFIEIPENKAYEISYDFNGFTLCCESVNGDGSDSWFYIVPIRQERPVSEEDIRNYLSLDEDEMVRRLGKYYSIEEWIEAPDGIRGVNAYYYDELSLGFVFDQNKKLEFIYVNPYGFLLNGEKIGTDFDEVRKRFGDAPAEIVDLNGEQAYELRYRFDGYDVLVHAASPDSEYCSVFISKPE